MAPGETTATELYEALIDYLDTYFGRRDLEGTVARLAPGHCGYGTSLDETVYDIGTARRLFARDIEQAPNRVYYSIRKLAVTPLSDDHGVVMCELNIRTMIEEQELRFKNMRQTLVFSRIDGNWLIRHLHISFPAAEEHGADESYPNRELEEQTVVLQRLVDTKTAQLRNAMERIEHLAATDKLTGVHNRLKLDELLEAELARSARTGRPFSVILIDIDHFKRINDEHGHLVGDSFLKAFTSLLSARIRSTDAIGRWGGEEFLILCPETAKSDAHALAEDLRSAISGHTFEGAGHATASLGIAEFAPDDTSERIMKRADDALYTAKNLGRDRVQVNSL